MRPVQRTETEEARVQYERIRSAERRQRETAEERENRLVAQRNRNRITVDTETDDERDERLRYRRNRDRISRENENVEERENRLLARRNRYRNARENETVDEIENRLLAQRNRYRIARENESVEERENRLLAQRNRYRIARENETVEERENRLLAQRNRYRNARQNETVEERENRLLAQRNRYRNARENETAEDREARNALRTNRIQNFENLAFSYDPNIDFHDIPCLKIGFMDIVCLHCGSLKWKNEPPGMCCSNGKVRLPTLESPPEPLKSLLTGDTSKSRHFLENIRKYNSCFQMTSFGASKEMCGEGFMPTFKIQGQVYHKIGSLLPACGEEPQFLQIYFMGDSTVETNRRCSIIPNVRNDIISELQLLLHANNAYIKLFKNALDQMPTDDYKVVIKADKTPTGSHPGRFNVPTTNEVAIVMVGNEFEKRDIVLRRKNNTLQRVAETHRSYDSLQYPLIFWQGEDGYYFGIPQVDPSSGNFIPRKTVSAMNFYSYRIMAKVGEDNHILKFRQLFNQFVVDMYAKIESERLLYIRLNQSRLRSEEYIHLRDAVQNEANPDQLGKMIILPSSVTGSPRHMHEYTQDAMTYVKKYGKPDLFITFTCNSAWQEIKSHLMLGQKSMDRHDLIARVFKQKLNKMIELITKSCIFGHSRCWMYSIEWQKRGLPHAHILVWLRQKIRSTDIDKIISAELPNPEEDPLLYEVITKNMIHGPCGKLNTNSPCMVDGRCIKKYPRNFIDETQSGQDGYPMYRRRSPTNGGYTAKIKLRSCLGQEIEIDNKWIVPYNPLLSKIFQAHINIEWCHSVKSIKYICKYVNKGSDQAVFQLQNQVDEIQAFQTGRYISSNEAVWRILGMSIHERHPTVVHLSVHLENGQRVYFNPQNVQQRINTPPDTTLTAFFKLCQIDEFAKTILYCDVPQYYTWNAARKVFERRKQGQCLQGHPGIRSSDALGRVYTVHPSNAECFYLRMLLHEVKGPTSFADLKTVDGTTYLTYRETCEKRGLLESDNHWDLTLEEACNLRSPMRIRHLFALLLTTCCISNPLNLWEKYKMDMSEDILHNLRTENPDLTIDYSTEIYNEALLLLENICLSISGKQLNNYGMPTPNRTPNSNLCSDLLRERNYNNAELTEYIGVNQPLLVADQKVVYNEILQLVNLKVGGIVFLDAPGGTGKTFLINLILAKIRLQNQIALAVASSGIAATLLTGGRTAHSTFKLPLNIIHNDNPVCDISKNSGKGKLLQECSIIIWDECTMAHKRMIEALNRTLQDLRSNNSLMGGVVLLLAGDFRQILPVIPRSTMADELNACLKASYLWRHVQKFTLNTNMRVHLTGDASADLFAQWLLKIGEGKVPSDPQTGLIEFKKEFCQLVTSVEDLKVNVFPDIQTNYCNHQWLCERAVLAPKNDSVEMMNYQIQNLLPGDSKIFNSIDTTIDPSQSTLYPVEFLNSLNPAGLPPHKLELKIGVPIIMLRNLDPPKLCNGTRLAVKKLYSNIIEATILTGCAMGEDVFIPRIPLMPTDLPFEFKRLQFPVRLAFAMSINKAQGQTLKVAGINLEYPCFTHGQLYVACSRVGNPKNLYIFTKEGKTKNIVYSKALK